MNEFQFKQLLHMVYLSTQLVCHTIMISTINLDPDDRRANKVFDETSESIKEIDRAMKEMIK